LTPVRGCTVAQSYSLKTMMDIVKVSLNNIITLQVQDICWSIWNNTIVVSTA
jgi:hypothetical protein